MPVPQEVRGGQGGARAQRIDCAERAAAENDAVEVGGWGGIEFRSGASSKNEKSRPVLQKWLSLVLIVVWGGGVTRLSRE